MKISLAEEFDQGKMLLTVIPTQEYTATVNDLVQQLNGQFNRIMYISLNKLITPLKRQLQEQGIAMEKFSFVDGITKTAIPNPPDTPDVVFVPSPDDLTKLSIAVTKVLQNFDPDVLFFESLSTLLIYEDANVVNQFVHSLVNKVNAYGIRAVFTCLDGEKEQELIGALSLTLDRVVRQSKE